MLFDSFSLNGTWEMAYSETVYTSELNPWVQNGAAPIANSIKKAFPVVNAVPGYWEDMKEAFCLAPFYGALKINPEFGSQSYPIAGVCPDMALPNIMGNFFYRRTFRCEGIVDPSAIHFEGVQNACSVWLNGVFLGRHEGYSTPFDVGIPTGILCDGENEIVLSVSNIGLTGYSGEPISGLTNRAANQYTGGITGDVELRVYNCALRDVAVLISDDCATATVNIDSVEPGSFHWSVLNGNKVIKTGIADGFFTFETAGLDRWTPECPKLYTLRITCGDSVMERRFGVRKLVADGTHFKLNGKPVLLRGICEHCYFPETVHPNHDLSFYRNVIRTIKKLGFNFIRFHTFIPAEEYMQAADELGIMMHVESPNNTSYDEWKQIVSFCRRHTSVVIYCCGNELQMDYPFIDHLCKCSEVVHSETDALFAPMSALRGLDYCFQLEPDQYPYVVKEPLEHHPVRIEIVKKFSDLLNTGGHSHLSYRSTHADPKLLDEWNNLIYKDVPLMIHEICIQGTYTDLSLKDRYANSNINQSDMFPSIERHLKKKGLLHKAPLFFKNSSEWQRRLRKHNFEQARLCQRTAGFDFLGPIDTHWHTFGYDVGMMNEFYELKPGETVRNVLMYNSATVLLNELNTLVVFQSGEELKTGILTSHFGYDDLVDAELNVRLTENGKLFHSERKQIGRVEAGKLSRLHELCVQLPVVDKPAAMKLYVTLESGDTYVENEWELYVFPVDEAVDPGELIVSEGMTLEELTEAMREGKDVLLLGAEPFRSLPTSFQMALAGRTDGNPATVIYDHPALKDLPHDGFCGWQFRRLLEKGRAVCFEDESVPFDPIIELAATHKYALRESALFEYRVMNGRLLVCSLCFDNKTVGGVAKDIWGDTRIHTKFESDDPAALWLKNRLIRYASSEEFDPAHTISEEQLMALANAWFVVPAGNTNFALNANDKTAFR